MLDSSVGWVLPEMAMSIQLWAIVVGLLTGENGNVVSEMCVWCDEYGEIG